MPLYPFTLLHPQTYLIQVPTCVPHLSYPTQSHRKLCSLIADTIARGSYLQMTKWPDAPLWKGEVLMLVSARSVKNPPLHWFYLVPGKRSCRWSWRFESRTSRGYRFFVAGMMRSAKGAAEVISRRRNNIIDMLNAERDSATSDLFFSLQDLIYIEDRRSEIDVIHLVRAPP